jgi:hypothetical protein
LETPAAADGVLTGDLRVVASLVAELAAVGVFLAVFGADFLLPLGVGTVAPEASRFRLTWSNKSSSAVFFLLLAPPDLRDDDGVVRFWPDLADGVVDALRASALECDFLWQMITLTRVDVKSQKSQVKGPVATDGLVDVLDRMGDACRLIRTSWSERMGVMAATGESLTGFGLEPAVVLLTGDLISWRLGDLASFAFGLTNMSLYLKKFAILASETKNGNDSKLTWTV